MLWKKGIAVSAAGGMSCTNGRCVRVAATCGCRRCSTGSGTLT